jgi:glycosyltransferase involved in cell wall biosynthesis
MNRPRLSVIMPIRGSGMFLADALRSLTAQSIPVDELLVVDDGMDEAAKDTVSNCVGIEKLVLLQGGGKGPAAARNVGINAAEADIIGFLDDDDIWPQDKLKLQISRLTRHPDEVAVGGRCLWFSVWDHDSDQPAKTPDAQVVVHANLGAYLFRRDVFRRLGQFDETQTFAEDVDFILRLVDAGEPFRILDQPTLYYRRHHASMTAARSELEKSDFRRALFRSVKRRSRGLPASRSLSDRLVSHIAEPFE